MHRRRHRDARALTLGAAVALGVGAGLVACDRGSAESTTAAPSTAGETATGDVGARDGTGAPSAPRNDDEAAGSDAQLNDVYVERHCGADCSGNPCLSTERRCTCLEVEGVCQVVACQMDEACAEEYAAAPSDDGSG